jgi:hypothetical protein
MIFIENKNKTKGSEKVAKKGNNSTKTQRKEEEI